MHIEQNDYVYILRPIGESSLNAANNSKDTAVTQSVV